MTTSACASFLEFFLDHHYVNCGMPDGGVVETKQDNPLVTNAFFNILDLRIIRRNFSMKLLADYRVWKPEWETLIPAHMMRTPYRFWMYEPYYPFSVIWPSISRRSIWMPGLIRMGSALVCWIIAARFFCFTPGFRESTEFHRSIRRGSMRFLRNAAENYGFPNGGCREPAFWRESGSNVCTVHISRDG